MVLQSHPTCPAATPYSILPTICIQPQAIWRTSDAPASSNCPNYKFGWSGAPPTTTPSAQSNAPPPFPSNDATVNVQAPQAQVPYFLPPPMPMVHAKPLWYLGTPIVDAHAPPAPYGVVKVQGYDRAVDYGRIQKATGSGRADEAKCMFFPFLVPSVPMT